MTLAENIPSKAGRLSGRRILMTGAASGIGQATARTFASAGASLALLDRDDAGLRRMERELSAVGVVVDLVDENAIRTSVARAAEALGGLDGVVNVAGISMVEHPLNVLTLNDWNRALTVNLTAPFLICREAAPHLKKAGGGTIVNVASASGLMPLAPGMGAYCASKGGLISFSKAIALELAPEIRVNAVCPGATDTPMLVGPMRSFTSAPTAPYALKRVAKPEEIADAILFLTSVESSFMTGIALPIDGGRSYH